MVKKAKEYAAGDFIFAKVKGYPAWPARIQKPNGKKYLVYFYGTGETANLPPNQVFDYADNKDKFLTKTVKRKDFNDGVRQIEHDFANKVPLEDVIGIPVDEPMDTSANDTANDSAIDTTAADTTVADTTTTGDETNTTSQNDTAVEDSDEGMLVIDEGSKKGKKSAAKTPAKEPPKPKEPKTPRGKPKKEEIEEKRDEKEPGEEIVSRSGRKIRPKRFVDEHTEDNATLPSPAAKRKRGGSPTADKEKTKAPDSAAIEKNKQYNPITQSELEDLKEPLSAEDAQRDNILIASLPNGQYVGIKLFQSRPTNFRNDAARLLWEKQAASNAITLKMQLEKGHISIASVSAQLETDLNLTDEEKANLDKEREIEEKKSRVNFLKTEMKLIELDAKIKSCLSLEKADTELCLKLLDELMELEVKPMMLLKHAPCLETVKRMRAYVGNTPSWEMSESEAINFSKQASHIRKKADKAYQQLKALFVLPDGLSFWEYFSERVAQFKKCTCKLTADERLEMIHEPIEMSMPTSHTMKAAIEKANKDISPEVDEPVSKIKKTPVKNKKAEKAASSTPSKQPAKRQSSRNKPAEPEESGQNAQEKETTAEKTSETAEIATETAKEPEKANEKDSDNAIDEESSKTEAETPKQTITDNKEEQNSTDAAKSQENGDATDEKQDEGKEREENAPDTEQKKVVEKDKKEIAKEKREAEKEKREAEKREKLADKKEKQAEKKEKQLEKKIKESEKKEADKKAKESEQKEKESEQKAKESEKNDEESETEDKDVGKKDTDVEKKDKDVEKKDKDAEKKDQDAVKKDKDVEKKDKVVEKKDTDVEKKDKDVEKKDKDVEKKDKDVEKKDKDVEKKDKVAEKKDKDVEKRDKVAEKKGKDVEKRDKVAEKEESGEPRAKRGRGENKKTEPATPKSPPPKRKSSRT